MSDLTVWAQLPSGRKAVVSAAAAKADERIKVLDEPTTSRNGDRRPSEPAKPRVSKGGTPKNSAKKAGATNTPEEAS